MRVIRPVFQKGNSPDRRLRSPNAVLSGKGCRTSQNNQDVGSEAATIQRVRNSSLVERPCAEDVRGSSTEPKSRDAQASVGERSKQVEGRPEGRLDSLEVRMLV